MLAISLVIIFGCDEGEYVVNVDGDLSRIHCMS